MHTCASLQEKSDGSENRACSWERREPTDRQGAEDGLSPRLEAWRSFPCWMSTAPGPVTSSCFQFLPEGMGLSMTAVPGCPTFVLWKQMTCFLVWQVQRRTGILPSMAYTESPHSRLTQPDDETWDFRADGIYLRFWT